MPDQERSASGTAHDQTTTAAGDGGASLQTDEAAGRAGSGSGFALPVPGLPAGVDPKRMLWWGGLAALAAVEVIEWPVAVVVAAGSYVAERWARQDAHRDAGQQP